MKRQKRRESYPQNSGILLPIVGMVAFTALGYFIGDSIQKAHSIEVKKQLELKVEYLEQQLDYYRFEVGHASFTGEPDPSGRYRMAKQSTPNQAAASIERLTWPLKYQPYFNLPINNRQE